MFDKLYIKYNERYNAVDITGNFQKTCAICLVSFRGREIDLGNFYEDENGNLVLIVSKEKAKKYGHLVDVPIYTFKERL